MRRLLLILLIGSFLPICAQVKNFSVQISSNFPIISDVIKKSTIQRIIPSSSGLFITTNAGTVKESYNEKPGFNITTKFQVYQFKGLTIESGLSVQFYRYTRLAHVSGLSGLNSIQIPISTGIPIGTIMGYQLPRDPSGAILLNPGLEPSANLGKTTTLYLQLPITIGRSFLKNRLVLQGGLASNFLLNATEYKEKYSVQTGLSEYKDTHAGGFSKFIVSGIFRTTYFVAKNIGLDLEYHRSFNSIYSASPVGKSYYNIFSVGASYHFFKQAQ